MVISWETNKKTRGTWWNMYENVGKECDFSDEWWKIMICKDETIL